MKMDAMFGVATLTACLAATSASAYQFSPPQIRSVLSGVMTFTPSQGGSPFSCNVKISLRTRGQMSQKGGFTKPAKIEAVNIKSTGVCRNISFVGLPWRVNVTSANGGDIVGGTWIGNGGCSSDDTSFTVNSAGNFSVPSGCVAGNLSSNPVVQIVP